LVKCYKRKKKQQILHIYTPLKKVDRPPMMMIDGDFMARLKVSHRFHIPY